jgi:hypothetical protein
LEKNRTDGGVKMHEECLICKGPLEYLEKDEPMECELCHKIQKSKARCVNGHFVCDECHRSGIDQIISICLDNNSKDPIQIVEEMMNMESCHMHGPEHHIMVGAALLTAYKNAGGNIDLKESLYEMQERGKQVPGGTCGFWGACGAGISSGIYMAIISKSTPLERKPWKLSNKMTSRALDKIGENGGPRCCKRNSYLSILEAIDFTKENLGIEMIKRQVKCTRSHMNNQCIKEECPFYHKPKKKVAFILKEQLK